MSLFILLSSWLLISCEQQSRIYNAEFYVFGTIVQVSLREVDPKLAEAAFSQLQQAFQQMHQEWHPWEPGALGDLNQALATRQSAEATADIITLIRRSQDLETITAGRFNPAIGGLINLWGFHTSSFPILGPPPGETEIQALVEQAPSTHNIFIQGNRVSSNNPAVMLDFSGIAKGYAVDKACTLLKDLGIQHAVVNAGGDLRVMGDHGNRGWRIAISKPGDESDTSIIGGLEVRDNEAIFTSGNYQRFRQDNHERYPHILDPKTGWPIQHIASVTVVSEDAMLADAAATALVVAGIEDWPALATALELDQVLVVDETGQAYITPAMEDRLEFNFSTSQTLKVVEIGGGEESAAQEAAD